MRRTSLFRKGCVAVVAAVSVLGLGLSACSKASSNDSKSSAKQKPVVLWVDSDGCVTAQQYCNVFLSSVLKNDQAAVQLAVENGSAGIFPTKDTVGDLKNGGTGLGSYHDFASKVPSALKVELTTVKNDIISGKIKIASKAQPTGDTTLSAPASGKANPNFPACMVT